MSAFGLPWGPLELRSVHPRVCLGIGEGLGLSKGCLSNAIRCVVQGLAWDWLPSYGIGIAKGLLLDYLEITPGSLPDY